MESRIKIHKVRLKVLNGLVKNTYELFSFAFNFRLFSIVFGFRASQRKDRGHSFVFLFWFQMVVIPLSKNLYECQSGRTFFLFWASVLSI